MKEQMLSGVNLKDCIPATQIKLFNFDAKPFLKWAGGKGQLIPELVDRLPEKFKKVCTFLFILNHSLEVVHFSFIYNPVFR